MMPVPRSQGGERGQGAGGPSASSRRAPERREAGSREGARAGPRTAARDPHDDPVALARYYDLDLADDPGDVDLYLALAARSGGPVLELAAGSGRIAVPLARSGHAVTAVDLDPAMLARARDRWAAAHPRRGGTGSLELVRANLFDLDPDPRFGLAILALNTLFLLGDADRQAEAIRVLATQLRPGGVAVIDVWQPGAWDLALYDGRLALEWVRDDSETGERVAKTVSASYDAATRTAELTTIFDAFPAAGGPVIRHLRRDVVHLASASEIVRAAEEAGLSVEQLGSDYELSPFGVGASRAVLVARARALAW